MSRALTEYHNFLAYVILSAPSNFPEEDFLQAHEQMTLEKAFEELIANFDLVKARVKDKDTMLILRELLTMGYESYLNADEVPGIFILQEFETLIWPSVGAPIEFSALAKQRIKERSNV